MTEHSKAQMKAATPYEQKQLQRFNVEWQVVPPMPREVLFDLNTHCNHRCFFCSNHRIAERIFMDKDLMLRLMRECREFGVTDIGLYATGEPFLRRDLAEIVRFAKDFGFSYIFITTNGALATPARAKEVIDAGIHSIKFSINAGNRESYRMVHGKDDFDKVIRHLRWCHQYRTANKVDVKLYVSMVPTHVTGGQWEQLLALVGDCVDGSSLRHCSNQGGNMLENNQTETIDSKNLLGSLPAGLAQGGRCPDPFYRVVITPEGYLTNCVVDYQNALCVADLRTTTLKDAWGNEHARRLRTAHLEGKLEGLICDCCLTNTGAPFKPIRPELARPSRKPPRRIIEMNKRCEEATASYGKRPS